MKTILYIIAYSIIISFLVFVIYSMIYSNEMALIEKQQHYNEFSELTINDIVKEKFIDKKNHSFCILVLKSKKIFNLAISDTFDFYNYILPNDSIVKEKGSDTITVFRGTNIAKFRLERGIIE